jgi:hypothetical protein
MAPHIEVKEGGHWKVVPGTKHKTGEYSAGSRAASRAIEKARREGQQVREVGDDWGPAGCHK